MSRALTSRTQVVLGLRRVYILPTRTGIGFLGVLLIMLVGSINYNASLGYVLTFWLGSLFLVSILHSYRNLAGVSVVGGRAPPVFAGELAAFEVTLVNGAVHPRRGIMLRFNPGVEDVQGGAPAPKTGNAARSALLRTDLPASDRTRLSLPVRAVRRGWLPLDSIIVATRYPFGLLRAWSVVDTEVRCLIYPRPWGTNHLPAQGEGSGTDDVVSGQGNEDFAGLRLYRPGDPVRHIHWKAASRSEEVPLKEFSGVASADLMLVYESVPGDTEARLSQLTLWVLEAEAKGLRYGLELPGVRLSPGHGDAHMHQCLRQLALHGVDG